MMESMKKKYKKIGFPTFKLSTSNTNLL